MANRMISYGYGIKNGKLVVIEYEAQVVRQIFSDYIGGKILKDIADDLNARNIEFYNGSCVWNKNRIFRIIENRKYIGEEGYPQIVSFDEFEQANNLKNEKGNKQTACSDDVDILKTLVFCGECGKLLYRRSKWKTREKWLCHSSCKCAKYIDDKTILSAITTAIEKIKVNPEILSTTEEMETYKRTQEIMRYTNEISRLTNTQNPSFKAGKKMIFESVNLKFQECKENKSIAYTEMINRMIQELADGIPNTVFIKKAIAKITIATDGTITVKFRNGIEITDKEESNAGASEKNSNEDRCQSATS